MHERKSKIPLDVQLMMATGPVNNREVVYYPWSDQGAARAPPSQQMRVQQQQAAENEAILKQREGACHQEEHVQEFAGIAKV
ncbi:hypothetical protein COOONC_15798 [Cooperia oncophora]